jgi:hypothetical protein
MTANELRLTKADRMTVERRRAATATISDNIEMERAITASAVASRVIADYFYEEINKPQAQIDCGSIHRIDFSPIICARKVLDALVEAGYVIAEPPPAEGDPIFEALGEWLTEHPSERVLPIVTSNQ